MTRLPKIEQPLTDGQIILRPWTMEDVEVMTRACQDPEIQRWTRVPENYTAADARLFIGDTERRRQEGESLSLAAADSKSQQILGSVALVSISWQDKRAEIGYWVAPQGRQQGVAVRAVRLLSRWVFENLDLERLGIIVAVGNTPSARVAMNAGFKAEGVLRSYLQSKQGRCDAIVHGLLRHELNG